MAGSAAPPGDYPAFTGGPPTAGSTTDPRVLAKLAGAIEQNTAQSAVAARLNAPDGAGNAGLAAGYSYLWQLAGHDLAMTRITGARALFAEDAENLRRHPLVLDSLLGPGALACPHAYEATGGGLRLRTGRMGARAGDGRPGWSDPARDLPRARHEGRSGVEPAPLDIVLIPDARNDDNLILAQLTALFHHVANLILAEAERRAGPDEDAERLGREVMQALWQRLLRRDLLRRILHPAVYAAYDGATPPQAGPPAARGRPAAEFVFAALRLGHGMVRDRYRLNAEVDLPLSDVIAQASSQSPGRMPMPAGYLIDWALFFPTPGAATPPDRINWAFRFGPHLAQDMSTARAASTPLPGQEPIPGTAFRDLYRGAEAGLASAPELIAVIRQRSLHLAHAAFGAAGGPDWAEIVRAGLDGLFAPQVNHGHHRLTKDERAAIIARPPLILTLMFEAEALGEGGRRLGPLGSILVAEGMRALFEAPRAEIQARLAMIEVAALGSVIADMSALIGALQAKRPDLFPQTPTM